jgi:uncharacterized membrane protein
MNEYKKEEIPYERILFFTDAVVAIAITLLALDLRLELSEEHVFTFHDLLLPWKNYLAFALSFIIIADFWKTHHSIFTYIHKMDEVLLSLNVAWLFFIITLPFCASVLSSHFDTTPAIFLYSLNIFMLSIIQNFIWDYADTREGFVNRETLSKEKDEWIQMIFNLDMVNGLVAIVVSFISPLAAFLLLLFKVPGLVLTAFFIRRRRQRVRAKREEV